MTDFYIDPTATVNGGGTRSNPYNVFPTTLAAGNRYLLKAGTTYTPGAGLSGIHIAQSGIDDNNRIVIGAYGVGSRPIINGANVARGINLANNVHHVTIQGLRITNVNSGTSRRGITNATTNSSGSIDTSINIVNCEIDNVLTDTVNDCDGIQLFGANNKILNCWIHHVADDGIWYLGDSIEIGNCTVTNVAVSGRVAGDCVQCGGSSDNGWIHGNTLDHSTDANKQCFIINSTCDGLRFEDNICVGNPSANFTTVYLVGVTNAIVRRNRMTGGANAHLNANGTGMLIYGNLFVNSSGRCMDLNANGIRVFNNTIIGNSLAGIYGVRQSVVLADNVVQNNCFKGWDRGIQATTGCSADHNSFFTCTTNISGITSGGYDVTADPLLNATTYVPATNSPVIGAGVFIDVDEVWNGARSAPTNPNMGAF